MSLGLGLLRLPPRDFWAMTLPELAAATRGLRGENGAFPALGSADLSELMRLFPDGMEE